jgi:hypothetical protein
MVSGTRPRCGCSARRVQDVPIVWPAPYAPAARRSVVAVQVARFVDVDAFASLAEPFLFRREPQNNTSRPDGRRNERADRAMFGRGAPI